MDTVIRNNLKIFGEGSSDGGFYDNVDIYGNGNIINHLECNEFLCTGQCDVKGILKAKKASLYGKNLIRGTLEAEEIKIKGIVKIEGNLEVGEAKVKGIMDIGGDCNTENLTLAGSFTIGGMLNSEDVEISAYKPCSVQEIGGRDIKVKQTWVFYLMRLTNLVKSLDFTPCLSAEVIEGDNIYLEYTRARVVRGNNVTLGPGCEIELVEYNDNLNRDNGANVGTCRKI